MLWALPSNSRCLQSHRLATVLYVTVLNEQKVFLNCAWNIRLECHQNKGLSEFQGLYFFWDVTGRNFTGVGSSVVARRAPPVIHGHSQTSHTVWTGFLSNMQLRWLYRLDKIRGLRDLSCVDAFGPFLFVRDFATCHITWGVTSQFAIYIPIAEVLFSGSFT
jgi:hypothetical protein